jgi:serine/threonine protein kinase
MKYCASCGARYEEAAKFCQHDGTLLRQAGAAEEEEDPYVGQTLLGQFQVEEVIGQGGMGRVYRARQLGFDRPVAIKILHTDLVTNTEMVKRFNREARIISRLDHPGIIHVYLFGELPDGNLYLAMEYVDGRSLTELMAGGPLPVDTSVHIVRQILSALTEAHRKGVVHRDLKPDNIMLVQRSDDALSVKVLDFGIAKFLGSRTMLTQQGLVFGSARYISPEAAAGETVDERADLYAVGVILYQMLAGRPPFDDSSAVSLLMRHVNDPPPPLLEQPGATDVPATIAAVVMQSLKKDPSHRFDDATAMRAALSEAARADGVDLPGPDDMSHVRRRTPPPQEAVEDAPATWVDEDREGAFRTDPMFGPAVTKPAVAPPTIPTTRASDPEPPPATHAEEPRGPTTQASSKPFRDAQDSPAPVPVPAPVPPSLPLPAPLVTTDHEDHEEEEEVHVPRSRAWIVLLVLLLLAIAGGAAAALLSGRGGARHAAPSTGAAETADPGPSAASTGGAGEGSPSPEPAPDAAPVSPGTPATVSPSVEITAGTEHTKRAAVGTAPVEPQPDRDGGLPESVPPLSARAEAGSAAEAESSSMPPLVALKLEPRRPVVGSKVRLVARVEPAAPLTTPRFVVSSRGEKSMTLDASAEVDGRYVASHSFEKAGSYQVSFVAEHEDGEVRAFTDIDVVPRGSGKRPPGIRPMPDFDPEHPGIPRDPEDKPPIPGEPRLLPPWNSGDPPPPW